jgi:hypothetical protein
MAEKNLGYPKWIDGKRIDGPSGVDPVTGLETAEVLRTLALDRTARTLVEQIRPLIAETLRKFA